MSKAMAFFEPGGPGALRLIDVDEPKAGPGQVRIRVKAAGVQPFDLAVVGGWTPPGADPGLPCIPGNEFAGIIDQLGEDVTGFTVGDEVLGFGLLNSYAEFVVTPADQITAKPQNMTWEVAGGFSAGAQTAHIALHELRVEAGDILLVHGAAGSVGSVAVQLARLRGITVVGPPAPPSTSTSARSARSPSGTARDSSTGCAPWRPPASQQPSTESGVRRWTPPWNSSRTVAAS